MTSKTYINGVLVDLFNQKYRRRPPRTKMTGLCFNMFQTYAVLILLNHCFISKKNKKGN